jgi:hypothetical protein
MPNKALHRMAIPLRPIAAGEFVRFATAKDGIPHLGYVNLRELEKIRQLEKRA